MVTHLDRDEPRRVDRADAFDHLDARGAEALDAVAGDVRVRVARADDDPRDLRGDERFGARRCAAQVVARFEGYVERRPFDVAAGRAHRRDLGVLLARALVETLADDLPTAHEDRPHVGVRRWVTEPPELEGPAHKALVLGLVARRTCPRHGASPFFSLVSRARRSRISGAAGATPSGRELSGRGVPLSRAIFSSSLMNSSMSRKERYTLAKRT